MLVLRCDKDVASHTNISFNVICALLSDLYHIFKNEVHVFYSKYMLYMVNKVTVSFCQTDKCIFNVEISFKS